MVRSMWALRVVRSVLGAFEMGVVRGPAAALRVAFAPLHAWRVQGLWSSRLSMGDCCVGEGTWEVFRRVKMPCNAL